MYLRNRITINSEAALLSADAAILRDTAFGAGAEGWYRQQGFAYPKFFKMDLLCKWAWLGAQLLLQESDGTMAYHGIDATRIALVLVTDAGCLYADKRYEETLEEIASPALFVYTLPNIMLGELSIAHGFKGEQLCLIQPVSDTTLLYDAVEDLLANRGMEACLCGVVEARDEAAAFAQLFWITKTAGGNSQPANRETFRTSLPANLDL